MSSPADAAASADKIFVAPCGPNGRRHDTLTPLSQLVGEAQPWQDGTVEGRFIMPHRYCTLLTIAKLSLDTPHEQTCGVLVAFGISDGQPWPSALPVLRILP